MVRSEVPQSLNAGELPSNSGVGGYMVGEEEPGCLGWEVSAVNPAARRRPGGIWNEDLLPVLDWEAPMHRVVIPTATRELLGISEDVLRWSSFKHERALIDHPRDLKYINDPTRWLAGPKFVGRDKRKGRERDLIVIASDDHRWVKIVLGFNNLSGRHQMVTIYATGDEKILRKWIRQMVPIGSE